MGPWIILMVINFFLSRYGAIYQYEKDGIEAAGDVDKGSRGQLRNFGISITYLTFRHSRHIQSRK